MTEYDYSPEAYERYVRTQQRIAHWVDETEEHRPEFGAAGDISCNSPSSEGEMAHERQGRSMHEPRRRHSRSSSVSSSSSGAYSNSHRSPGPMPISTYQTLYLQQPAVHDQTHHHHSNSRHHPPSHHHHHHHHHQRPHRLPIYAADVLPSLGPGYPYGYPLNTGQGVSPGAYSFPTKVNNSGSSGMSRSSPYLPLNVPNSYTGSQTSYPFPQVPYPQAHPSGRPPPYYGPPTQPTFARPQAQYPQTAYPPTIYPLTASGYTAQPLQSAPIPHQKPLFYQRIFGDNGSSRHSDKKSSRRSH